MAVLKKIERSLTREQLMLILLAAIFIFGVVSGNSNETTIVFESSVGFFGLENEGPLGFSKLKNELELEGFKVDDTLKLKANYEEIEPKVLKKSDVYVIINPVRHLSFFERERIRDHVTDGGSVLLINDDPKTLKNANELAGFFEVHFLGQRIDSASIRLGDSRGRIVSAMPMRYEGQTEPDIFFTSKSASQVWEHYWDVGNELIDDEYYLLLGFQFGSGKILFLSDKDFLINHNFNQGSMDIFGDILTWFESKGPLKQNEPDSRIIPRSVSLSSHHGTLSYFRFLISNPSNLNTTVIIDLPETLESLVELDKYHFDLDPLSKKDVLATVKCAEDVSYIYDFVNITTSVDGFSEEDLLPIEVRCVAKI
jgi:hypothetical protein